jgi:hypothetical protein
MDIRERAAAALVRAREAGIPVPATDPPTGSGCAPH